MQLFSLEILVDMQAIMSYVLIQVTMNATIICVKLVVARKRKLRLALESF